MATRFRKTIKLLPGVKLNLSKSGISTSVGAPGSTLNFSSRGLKSTVGIPGTGISYSELYRPNGKKKSHASSSSEIKPEVKAWASTYDWKRKSFALALLLSPLGFFGAHRFYVRKRITGLFFALTLGFFGLWWLWDLIKVLRGSFTDQNGAPLMTRAELEHLNFIPQFPRRRLTVVRTAIAIVLCLICYIALYVFVDFVIREGSFPHPELLRIIPMITIPGIPSMVYLFGCKAETSDVRRHLNHQAMGNKGKCRDQFFNGYIK